MPAPMCHPPYSGCEMGGRPAKYSPADIEIFAEELIKWLKTPENVWFKDFCLERDINPDLMSNWAQENEKFSGAYKLAKYRQESKLVNGALTNIYNSNIVKFVLSNAHGWSDRAETKLSSDAVNPLTFILKSVDGLTKELVRDE